jgi:hypothetical protein
MEILNYHNGVLSASVSGLTASTNYLIELNDLITGEEYSASASSLTSGTVVFALPEYFTPYTAKLAASVKELQSEDLVKMFNIDIVRPYADISSMAAVLKISTTKATEYERLARYIIDAYTGGFDYLRKKKEFTGTASDELLIDEVLTGKIYSILENNEPFFERDPDVFDKNQEYVYKKQLSAIVYNKSEGNNRAEYTVVWRDRYLDIEFADGFEYLVDAEFGWKVIPQDIQEATELLVQDIVEDNLKYINKYIESFDNDDFKIKFTKGYAKDSTGNRIVDRILERYQKPILPGVL